jgi:TPR repeat protein
MWFLLATLVTSAWAEDAEITKKAFKTLTKACVEASDADACWQLHQAHLVGNGVVPRDLLQVAVMAKAACNAGHNEACVERGKLLETGRGAVTDPTGAVKLFAKACEGDVMSGCENLVRMLGDDYGVEAASEEGRAMLDTACTKGLKSACTRLEALAPPVEEKAAEEQTDEDKAVEETPDPVPATDEADSDG